MYHFTDLQFVQDQDNPKQQIAILGFKNGYGCIVIKGSPNTNFGNQYEFIQTRNNQPFFHPNINDGPVGYCTVQDIEDLLEEVQSLKHV